MHRRHLLIALPVTLLPWAARAHHGWSSFDTQRPLWLEGRAAQVQWRNPHVELVLEVPADARLPADLKQRTLPAQSSPVDGPALLAAAQLPTRRDRRWTVELAPLTRLDAWKVAPIAPGATLGVLGYTFAGEKGDAVLRAEYLFVDGKAYGLRSSPA
ncbi:DUF6152 family protein [Aquabacterium sp. J223]|uniref:DUF6152 family protein n=1 Tax=Aquabacterium sp. J223 TaxID=2898431 RepID=UPI0021AD63A2|nr:DUF6152 family protein [Aquabacterium sp. J223]UUX95711.1 DUF6152 family protein [Aquabacterium sp. J223]